MGQAALAVFQDRATLIASEQLAAQAYWVLPSRLLPAVISYWVVGTEDNQMFVVPVDGNYAWLFEVADFRDALRFLEAEREATLRSGPGSRWIWHAGHGIEGGEDVLGPCFVCTARAEVGRVPAGADPAHL